MSEPLQDNTEIEKDWAEIASLKSQLLTAQQAADDANEASQHNLQVALDACKERDEAVLALTCLLEEKPMPNGEYVHHVACSGNRRKPAGSLESCCSCRAGLRGKEQALAARNVMQAELDEAARRVGALTAGLHAITDACENCTPRSHLVELAFLALAGKDLSSQRPCDEAHPEHCKTCVYEENTALRQALGEVGVALKEAKQFISNGIELGYIARPSGHPECETVDHMSKALANPLVQASLDARKERHETH